MLSWPLIPSRRAILAGQNSRKEINRLKKGAVLVQKKKKREEFSLPPCVFPSYVVSVITLDGTGQAIYSLL